MAESLRAKRDRKSAISLQCGYFDPKFQVEGVAPTNHFCTVVTLQPFSSKAVEKFSHKETLQQTFFKRSVILDGNRPFCVFETPGGLKGNVRRSF